MIITLQIGTLKSLLESYDEDEHHYVMLSDAVDIFPEGLGLNEPAPSFGAAKRLLAKMLGNNLSDEEKLKLLLGFAIQGIEQVLSESSTPDPDLAS